MRRVVVTGVGAISPLGSTWEAVEQRLRARENAVAHILEWDEIEGLGTSLGVPVTDFTLPEHYTRKQTRSMGRVASMSVRATELALEQAGLLGDPLLNSGAVGVSYGSSTGSTDAQMEFGKMILHKSTDGLNATTYVRMMSHTAAVNIAVFFGLTGRVIPTSSACTAGSQGIGYAYEAIRFGMQDLMVAGGGEELCPTQAAIFDTLYATSTRNDEPGLTPRPYDSDRDGLVLGEGACTFVLEEREHALARGAHIYAELVGFGTNSDGTHVTRPNPDTMARCIAIALEQAALDGQAIGYVNAHGTATEFGDIAESNATSTTVRNDVPLSSLKSYIGHTLGACGSLEAWMAIEMMNTDWYAPTINLEKVDSRCGEVDYIMDDGRSISNEFIMSNNFAFGGINTSLIFQRVA
ncbi:MAG: beta-ketoacyl-ACP synthase [Gammaproteobacteria bacterium]